MGSKKGAHSNICERKQQERTEQLARVQGTQILPEDPQSAMLSSLSVEDLASQTTDAERERISMLYTSRTIAAQATCNCVTELLADDTSLTRDPTVSEESLDLPGACSTPGGANSRRRLSLRNVPISLKESIMLINHDTTLGLSKNAFKPATRSAPIVHLLQDTGALFIAKTTVPAGIFGIETESDLFGLTTNPLNSFFGPGASTGGGAALVALGGARIEIGSDVAGSLRLPAAFCGVYALKGSAGRFPATDNESTMPGLLSLPTIGGPIAANLEDLAFFYERVIEMCPWKYDPSCLPIPWRPYSKGNRKVRWGVIRGNHFIPASPASLRALHMVEEALRSDGHEVINFSPPVKEILEVGFQLTFSDGGEQLQSQFSPGERMLPVVKTILTLYWLPYIFKSVIAFLLRVLVGDNDTAIILEGTYTKTIAQERQLVVRRDELRQKWDQDWADNDFDFVITVCAPFPGIENGTADRASLFQASLVMLFNLLDYTAGVLPVTKVDRKQDSLTEDFTVLPEYRSMGLLAKYAYTVYDAEKMHGLPVGVQIAGRRLEEEKVLAGMKMIEEALQKN